MSAKNLAKRWPRKKITKTSRTVVVWKNLKMKLFFIPLLSFKDACNHCATVIFSLVLFASLWMLSGCATAPPPPSAYLQTSPSFSSELKAIDGVGLIADATILLDTSGAVSNRFIVLQDSRIVASNLLANASQALQTRGYPVIYAEMPALGTSLGPNTTAKAAENRGDKPAEISFPVVLSADLNSDANYRQALVKVVHQAFDSIGPSGELPEDRFRSDPSIADSLHLIADRTKTDYLVLILGRGLLVPAGKQLGQAFGTALISTVMTAGFITATRYDISYLDSYLGVVDLKKGELVWCNSLRQAGNPDSTDFYKGNWSRSMFYYLPDRTVSTAPIAPGSGPPAAVPLNIIVPPGKAVVCLYRDKEDPWDSKRHVMFQGHKIASLDRNEFFLHTVDPGQIVYKIPPGPNMVMALTLAHTEDSISTLRVESGNVYYLHLYNGALIRVDNAIGLAQASLCKQVQ